MLTPKPTRPRTLADLIERSWARIDERARYLDTGDRPAKRKNDRMRMMIDGQRAYRKRKARTGRTEV
jgi:hypothetical protein